MTAFLYCNRNRNTANVAVLNVSHFIMREPPPVVPLESEHELVVLLGWGGEDGVDAVIPPGTH